MQTVLTQDFYGWLRNVAAVANVGHSEPRGGVIQMDTNGKLVRSIAVGMGTAVGQTAVVIEMAALLVALYLARDCSVVEIVSGCDTVVLGHKTIDQLADSYNHIHAGIWRKVGGISLDKNLQVVVTKVKAHRKKEDVGEQDMYNWQGNELADQWARLGSTDRNKKRCRSGGGDPHTEFAQSKKGGHVVV